MSEHGNGYDAHAGDQLLARRIDLVEESTRQTRGYIATVEGDVITSTSRLEQAVHKLTEAIGNLSLSTANRLDELARKTEAKVAKLAETVMDVRVHQMEGEKRAEEAVVAIIDLQKDFKDFKLSVAKISGQQTELLRLVRDRP